MPFGHFQWMNYVFNEIHKLWTWGIDLDSVCNVADWSEHSFYEVVILIPGFCKWEHIIIIIFIFFFSDWKCNKKPELNDNQAFCTKIKMFLHNKSTQACCVGLNEIQRQKNVCESWQADPYFFIEDPSPAPK